MAKPLDLSVIIPVAPGADPGPAMRAVAKDMPRGLTWEVVTVAGVHPTRQRNLAALRSRGRFLYFLDHDSVPQRGTVGKLVAALRGGRAAVAGGPNLAASPHSRFEGLAGDVIGSSLGTPGVTGRYQRAGITRSASERSLILCNLMVDRETFFAAGGFDPRLYPNEENEFMNRVSAAGGSMLLVPSAPVTKPRPATLGGLLRETFRYGRGRGEQIWINGYASDLPYMAAAAALVAGAWLCLRMPGILVGALGVELLVFLKGWRLPVTAALAIARHLSYGSGLLVGLGTGWSRRRVRLRPMAVEVRRHAAGIRDALRLVESHVFNIGSWSKEVPARA